jgi:hypothetical protein
MRVYIPSYIVLKVEPENIKLKELLDLYTKNLADDGDDDSTANPKMKINEEGEYYYDSDSENSGESVD